jgi:hypothetical protein
MSNTVKRGSALSRAIGFFETGDLREARVAYQIVKEVMEDRLANEKSSAARQNVAANRSRPNRTHKAKPSGGLERGPVPTTVASQNASANDESAKAVAGA